jgi:DNA replication and repair protein RecF
MRVIDLSLSNFRNYGRLALPLPGGATLLHGENAQGKTNVLEALFYLATTRSPHASQDSQLISWAAQQSDDPVSVGRIVANIQTSKSTQQVEMRLILERKSSDTVSFRREALVNRRKVRLMDLLGHLQVVLFLPEDVELITGAPSERRRYLDITLCQVDRRYCRALSAYNKILEQRNALLRQMAEGQGDSEVLDIFTEKLAEQGSIVFARRAAFFAAIERETQRIHYEELTGGRESLTLGYLPRLQYKQSSNGNGSDNDDDQTEAEWLQAEHKNLKAIAERFTKELGLAQGADIARGATSVGPHRDDWRFWVNGRHLGNYGSRGQQRSAILALKMAQIGWMEKLTGESPVLLLDEVVAELDENRRDLLLRYVQRAEQAILTATDPGMFSAGFLAEATILAVTAGRITVEKGAGESSETSL